MRGTSGAGRQSCAGRATRRGALRTTCRLCAGAKVRPASQQPSVPAAQALRRQLQIALTAVGAAEAVAVAGDPVIAFGGQRVKTLLNKIEAAMRQRRFSQRPIGPLGSLLSLTDDKWAVAVETAIGKCFNDFLVANMSDLEVLKVRHMLNMAVAPIVRLLVMPALHLCTWCAVVMPVMLRGVKRWSADHASGRVCTVRALWCRTSCGRLGFLRIGSLPSTSSPMACQGTTWAANHSHQPT